MEIRIRYENGFQTLELDAEATEGLWISLSLEEDDSLSEEERTQKLQEAVDEKLNKPEYNNWHRHQRHIGISRVACREGDDVDMTEIMLKDVADTSAFYKDVNDMKEKEDYEYYCQWVRRILAKKPEWAEAFIAVYLDGESIREYADKTGQNENNITQKLKRAKKKLAEEWINRQI